MPSATSARSGLRAAKSSAAIADRKKFSSCTWFQLYGSLSRGPSHATVFRFIQGNSSILRKLSPNKFYSSSCRHSLLKADIVCHCSPMAIRSTNVSAYRPVPIAAFDKPLDCQIVDDEVVFIGPGAVAFSMTFKASEETARRLNILLAAA